MNMEFKKYIKKSQDYKNYVQEKIKYKNMIEHKDIDSNLPVIIQHNKDNGIKLFNSKSDKNSNNSNSNSTFSKISSKSNESEEIVPFFNSNNNGKISIDDLNNKLFGSSEVKNYIREKKRILQLASLISKRNEVYKENNSKIIYNKHTNLAKVLENIMKREFRSFIKKLKIHKNNLLVSEKMSVEEYLINKQKLIIKQEIKQKNLEDKQQKRLKENIKKIGVKINIKDEKENLNSNINAKNYNEFESQKYDKIKNRIRYKNYIKDQDIFITAQNVNISKDNINYKRNNENNLLTMINTEPSRFQIYDSDNIRVDLKKFNSILNAKNFKNSIIKKEIISSNRMENQKKTQNYYNHKEIIKKEKLIDTLCNDTILNTDTIVNNIKPNKAITSTNININNTAYRNEIEGSNNFYDEYNKIIDELNEDYNLFLRIFTKENYLQKYPNLILKLKKNCEIYNNFFSLNKEAIKDLSSAKNKFKFQLNKSFNEVKKIRESLENLQNLVDHYIENPHLLI